MPRHVYHVHLRILNARLKGSLLLSRHRVSAKRVVGGVRHLAWRAEWQSDACVLIDVTPAKSALAASLFVGNSAPAAYAPDYPWSYVDHEKQPGCRDYIHPFAAVSFVKKAVKSTVTDVSFQCTYIPGCSVRRRLRQDVQSSAPNDFELGVDSSLDPEFAVVREAAAASSSNAQPESTSVAPPSNAVPPTTSGIVPLASAGVPPLSSTVDEEDDEDVLLQQVIAMSQQLDGDVDMETGHDTINEAVEGRGGCDRTCD
ncbi:hypothetical protein FISHEDRAFT_62885 [Fistulina hepatica ATCC 64428]|uniref:Uncharacterized protein n=1 Tax=Fistulina hepatica ATCC 64428 TaxID=1128425 RepID=A0A0D7A2S1_9AGAR|nr:hypothetical protein FISHEDRAFT_62885 [Fistulina hepatica ATCC 64428]